ncbi:hypothetical protein [Acetobacter ascendens]|nr:hypothetical protein [Acetobacter ascendens]
MTSRERGESTTLFPPSAIVIEPTMKLASSDARDCRNGRCWWQREGYDGS